MERRQIERRKQVGILRRVGSAMKARLITWLRWLLDWLDPPPNADLQMLTVQWMAHYDDLDASGEAKRHQVLARLMKAYPDARTRDLAWAIEQAMQRRGA